MSQLLITIEPAWYQSIANIRNYSEPDYEDKILKYGSEIFSNYYVLKCKFPFIYKKDRSQKYEPDFLLVSKNFKNWIIVEIELCRKPLFHTKKQVQCFSSPEFDAVELTNYLVSQLENIDIKVLKTNLEEL